MKYEERYILPLFHERSAGRTRTGEADYPYLQSVESKWDVVGKRVGSILPFIGICAAHQKFQ